MSIKNAAGDQVRLNVKNDQTYTLTAALAFTTLGPAVMQGYTTSPGDLGRASFTSNLTSASNFTMATSPAAFLDLDFASTAGSSTRDVFVNSADGAVFMRCVFHGGRGAGLSDSSRFVVCIECEAYDCNKNNSASVGGFIKGGSNIAVGFFYNCYSHDHGGSNGNCFVGSSGSAGQGMILVNCIADTGAGLGLLMNTTATAMPLVSINSNYYNNTSDGIRISAAAGLPWSVFINNNFLKNGGSAINNTVTSTGGILYNNGRGAGSQANTSADVLQSILDTSTDITYASGDTPWTAPTTGNFTTIPTSAARSAGRGAFTETDGTNTGTVAYPDIGAAQALVTPELRIPSIASV